MFSPLVLLVFGLSIGTSCYTTYTLLMNDTDAEFPLTGEKPRVEEDDFIYTKKRIADEWDTSAIVVEKYKLVFFPTPKVACTTFKQLFRLIEGYDDWNYQGTPESPPGKKHLPHDPNHNGLKYLWDYSTEEATRIMTSPEYTRAIYLRDPKLRFLSAFLDKVFQQYGQYILGKCCPTTNDCLVYTVGEFLDLIETCPDGHWGPQLYRIDLKFWPYINFVGHVETAYNDTKRLLQRIGAWEEYGKTGWGKHGNASIFASHANQNHVTYSQYQVWTWFTPALERRIEEYYKMDYAYRPFGFLAGQNLTKDFFVKREDKVYERGNWDGAPIILEDHKLAFFTIPKNAGTRWKMAFRRIMGLDDWNVIDGIKLLPHNPDKNGLKYLYDYDIEVASEIMTSPEWTRAVFVRNPKDRFMSVYYELSRNGGGTVKNNCCPEDQKCVSSLSSMTRFLDLMSNCRSSHWIPQYNRIESKYWPYINFIGRLEHFEEDSTKLLTKIGVYDEIGLSGWGEDGQQPIHYTTGHEMDAVRESLAQYTAAVDRSLDDYYKDDYSFKEFGFSRKVSVIG